MVVSQRMWKAPVVQSGRALPMGRCASPPLTLVCGCLGRIGPQPEKQYLVLWSQPMCDEHKRAARHLTPRLASDVKFYFYFDPL